MPVGGANVRPDEGHHGLHDEVLRHARRAREAGRRRHGEVPAVLSVLLLLAQRFEQQRHQRRHRATRVVLRAPLGFPLLLLCLLLLLHQIELLVANGRPELDGLLAHLVLLLVLRRALDTLQGEGVERLHVGCQEVVIRLCDADDALVRGEADVRPLGLRGLAHGLHDVVPLRLVVKVLLDKGERVIQRLRPGQPRVRISLLLSHALDDSSEDEVALRLQDIGVDLLADVP
mmetsp:Transcript_22157/g.52546  ORF Transcript_22157/g.52546 Transcript_22157/m.52546 type:complete len:231 (+) Transcript_22157:1502-2194(+)